MESVSRDEVTEQTALELYKQFLMPHFHDGKVPDSVRIEASQIRQFVSRKVKGPISERWLREICKRMLEYFPRKNWVVSFFPSGSSDNVRIQTVLVNKKAEASP